MTKGRGSYIRVFLADFDGDGHVDLFAGNFSHRDSRGDQPQSQFLRNRGPEHDFAFEDRGTGGVHYQESYASPGLADYDLDGDLDLFFTTVYGTASFGKENFPVLYRNDGAGTFTNVATATGVADDGYSHGITIFDYDRDYNIDYFGFKISLKLHFINDYSEKR